VCEGGIQYFQPHKDLVFPEDPGGSEDVLGLAPGVGAKGRQPRSGGGLQRGWGTTGGAIPSTRQ
jgi:hypothetical protein